MNKKKITRLTKAEEQVMQILWDLDESIIKDMITHFEDPKPAYTTVATVLRVNPIASIGLHRKVSAAFLVCQSIDMAL